MKRTKSSQIVKDLMDLMVTLGKRTEASKQVALEITPRDDFRIDMRPTPKAWGEFTLLNLRILLQVVILKYVTQPFVERRCESTKIVSGRRRGGYRTASMYR